MKQYNIRYSLNDRSPQRIYVSKNSSFRVGVAMFANGEQVSAVLNDGEQDLSSVGTLDIYDSYELESGSEEGTSRYSVKSGDATLALDVVTTNSNVAELKSGSGDIPEDVVTQDKLEAALVPYAKTAEVDTKLSDYALSSNVYDKNYVDIQFYTKQQVDYQHTQLTSHVMSQVDTKIAQAIGNVNEVLENALTGGE